MIVCIRSRAMSKNEHGGYLRPVSGVSRKLRYRSLNGSESWGSYPVSRPESSGGVVVDVDRTFVYSASLLEYGKSVSYGASGDVA